MNYGKKAIELHKKMRGKISVCPKVHLKTKEDLSTAYTPGVGVVSMAINTDVKKSWQLTNRANSVAIVTDGSAVLGLGNIGPEAAMPVMEGKSVIFKKLAGIDAYPLCINTQDTEEIIKFVKLIEPSFGGINLEDISAPRCFEILNRLEKEMAIPVFHDDQDGTAIIVLAALINACRISGKILNELSIVINGAGAAGLATARLLVANGVNNIFLADSKGLIYRGRTNLNSYKNEIAKKTNKKLLKGGKEIALADADVFIGLSRPKQLTSAAIKQMNKDPIILAMANPDPEIMPKEALLAGAAIVGTGRSDFPNQVNNALVFPGMFSGLLEGRIKKITPKMKISVAIAIAYCTKRPGKNKLLPNITDKCVTQAIKSAVLKNSK